MSDDQNDQRNERNFLRLALVQFTFRVGWIFKTESVIIPAALDSLATAGWIRGFLPLLSRLGLSVPPALFGKAIRNATRKKRSLAACIGCMSGCMALMSALWWSPGTGTVPIAVLLFLTCYVLFFAFNGLNQVAFGTLQGKVIPTRLRGRLMVAANLSSSVVGVALVLMLLPRWLGKSTPQFQWIFSVPAVWFGISALSALRIEEEADDPGQPYTTRQFVMSAVKLIRDCPALGTSLLIASLCGFSMVLFPHYQALAREQLGLDVSNISYWIAVQSLGAALFSTIAGPLADRHGNRLVLRLVILGIAATPLLALSLAALPQFGPALYPLVFVCIGLNPLMMRIFQNYTIEVADAARRPQALSALTLCWALPVMSAPLVGLLIDRQGFRPIFSAVAVVLGLGWVLTLRLSEPRHETD